MSDIVVEITSNPITVNFGTHDQVSGGTLVQTPGRVVTVKLPGTIDEDESLAVDNGAITGAKSMTAAGVAGFAIKNSSGETVATFGAGPGLDVDFATAAPGGLVGVLRFGQLPVQRVPNSYPSSLFRI